MNIYLGSYTNAQSHFKIKHKSCGHIFEITMINFRRGHRCPNCAFKSSSEPEKEILNIVRQYYPAADKMRFYPNKNNHRKFIEADICIEERKIVIEFDGLYWHSDARVDKYYHINKNKALEKLGYSTIHIFEDEWRYKKPEVLRELIGVLSCNSKDFRH